MMDARFVKLEAHAHASIAVWVYFRHVCEAKRGQDDKIDFVWDGIARGSALFCGCTPVVPQARWTRGRRVWEACRRLEGA